MNRTVASWSGAHSCGDVHHNCTFVRFSARAREDVQAWATWTAEHARAALSHEVIHKAIVAYMSNIDVDYELK